MNKMPRSLFLVIGLIVNLNNIFCSHQFSKHGPLFPRYSEQTWYRKLVGLPRPDGLHALRELVKKDQVDNDRVVEILERKWSVDRTSTTSREYYGDGRENVKLAIGQSNKNIKERLQDYWTVSGIGTRQLVKCLVGLGAGGILYKGSAFIDEKMGKPFLEKFLAPMLCGYGILSGIKIITSKNKLNHKEVDNATLQDHINSPKFIQFYGDRLKESTDGLLEFYRGKK